MAGKEFPLSIVLRAVDKSTAEFRRVNQRITELGKSVASAGRTLTTHLSLPIAGIGAASLAATAEFDRALASISTLIDTNKENLDAIGDTLLDIGSRTPVAVSDLAAALYDVRSAGVAASEQFVVLERSAQLAVAGLGTTKEAVDLVTSASNAFRLEGEDAEKVYDNIFKTVRNGKTTITGLAQGFGGVAGTIAASGTQLDEYLASVAALTTTGLPAAQAHTQIRAAIVGLTRDSEPLRKVWRKLGATDMKDLIEKSGGLVPALQRINALVGGNQVKLQKLIGSAEGVNAVLGLTGAQAETYTATLRDMREGADAVTVAFGKQNRTVASTSQRMRNALTKAGVAIGKILLPVVETLAGGLERLANWFGSLDNSTQKWIVTIGLVVAAVGPLLLLVGKLIIAFPALKAGIIAVTAALKGMNLAMHAIPIFIIVTGVLAWIKVFQELTANWELTKDAARALWEKIKEFFSPVVGFFKGIWDGVVAIFKRAWEFIERIVDRVKGAVEDVLSYGRMLGRGFRLPEQKFLTEESLAQPGTRGTSTTRVEVEFKNVPKETRILTGPVGADEVDISAGYAMGVP